MIGNDTTHDAEPERWAIVERNVTHDRVLLYVHDETHARDLTAALRARGTTATVVDAAADATVMHE